MPIFAIGSLLGIIASAPAPAAAAAGMSTGTAVLIGATTSAGTIKAGRMIYTGVKYDSIFADEITIFNTTLAFFSGKKVISSKDKIILLQSNIQKLTNELVEMTKIAVLEAEKNKELESNLEKTIEASTEAVAVLEGNIKILENDVKKLKGELEKKSKEEEASLTEFNRISTQVGKLIEKLNKYKEYKNLYISESKESEKWKNRFFDLANNIKKTRIECNQSDNIEYFFQEPKNLESSNIIEEKTSDMSLTKSSRDISYYREMAEEYLKRNPVRKVKIEEAPLAIDPVDESFDVNSGYNSDFLV